MNSGLSLIILKYHNIKRCNNPQEIRQGENKEIRQDENKEIRQDENKTGMRYNAGYRHIIITIASTRYIYLLCSYKGLFFTKGAAPTDESRKESYLQSQ